MGQTVFKDVWSQLEREESRLTEKMREDNADLEYLQNGVLLFKDGASSRVKMMNGSKSHVE